MGRTFLLKALHHGGGEMLFGNRPAIATGSVKQIGTAAIQSAECGDNLCIFRGMVSNDRSGIQNQFVFLEIIAEVFLLARIEAFTLR